MSESDKFQFIIETVIDHCYFIHTDTRKLAFEMLVFMATYVELSMYYLSLYNNDIDFNIIEDDSWTSDLAKQLGGKPYLSIAAPMIKSGLESYITNIYTNYKIY